MGRATETTELIIVRGRNAGNDRGLGILQCRRKGISQGRDKGAGERGERGVYPKKKRKTYQTVMLGSNKRTLDPREEEDASGSKGEGKSYEAR